MVAGFGKRYTIVYPDGYVEQRTLLGHPKHPGETLKLRGRRWLVATVVELVGEELDYEIHVVAEDG